MVAYSRSLGLGSSLLSGLGKFSQFHLRFRNHFTDRTQVCVSAIGMLLNHTRPEQELIFPAAQRHYRQGSQIDADRHCQFKYRLSMRYVRLLTFNA